MCVFLHRGRRASEEARIAVLPDEFTDVDVKQFAAAHHGAGVYKLTGHRNERPFQKTIAVNQFEAPQLRDDWANNAKNPSRGESGNGAVIYAGQPGDDALRDFLMQTVLARLDDLHHLIEEIRDEWYSDDEPTEDEDTKRMRMMRDMAEMFRGFGSGSSRPPHRHGDTSPFEEFAKTQ